MTNVAYSITHVYFFDDVISSDVSGVERDEEARVLLQVFDDKEVLKHQRVCGHHRL